MKQITLKAEKRELGKKSDVKNIRNAGGVPCVIYGNGMKNINFTLPIKEFNSLLFTPYSYIINLEIDGKTYMSVLHDVQFHPVTDKALHADFLAIDAKKPVIIDVPILITGNSAGVKQGGKFNQSLRKLRISALLANLPDDVTVDITNLEIGKQICAGDLSYDNITVVTHKGTIICSVRTSRQVTAEETAEAPADAATAPAGDAPAAEAKKE